MSRNGSSAARAHDLDDPAPLRVVRIDAGRVVAAGVQYDDRAGGQVLQRGDHAVEIQPVRRRVVVRIGVDGEPGAFEQRAMVLPGRVADPHLRARRETAQKIGADLERAGAAQRLNGDDAARLYDLGFGSEDQAAHRAVVGRDAVDRKVDVRAALVGQRALGTAHALEQRYLAVVVAIDADAEVDLARIRIGIERFGDAQDRVARRHFDRGEQRRGRAERSSSKRVAERSSFYHAGSAAVGPRRRVEIGAGDAM